MIIDSINTIIDAPVQTAAVLRTKLCKIRISRIYLVSHHSSRAFRITGRFGLLTFGFTKVYCVHSSTHCHSLISINQPALFFIAIISFLKFFCFFFKLGRIQLGINKDYARGHFYIFRIYLQELRNGDAQDQSTPSLESCQSNQLRLVWLMLHRCLVRLQLWTSVETF